LLTNLNDFLKKLQLDELIGKGNLDINIELHASSSSAPKHIFDNILVLSYKLIINIALPRNMSRSSEDSVTASSRRALVRRIA